MKVVINRCDGSFGLSDVAKEMLGIEDDFEYIFEREKRIDSKLVEVVEKLGDAANGPFSVLRIIEIPDDIEWTIEDRDEDGWEQIVEKHRVWP